MNSFTAFGPVLLMWSFHFQTIWSNVTSDYDSSTDYPLISVDYDIYNTVCDRTSNRDFRAWFLPTIYSIICLLALLGNFLVILTYIYFKRIKTMTDIFLLNLAVADLIFAVSLPFWAASMGEWHLGSFLCKAMHSIYKISFFSGMLLLTCISVDRYFSITKAVSAHRCRSNTVYYGRVSIMITWTIAILFSLPEILYSDVLGVNKTCDAYSNGHEHLRVPMQISQMILGFVIPALVMGFCYICIIKTLVQARNFEKNKALKVIFAVVAVFVVSQLPYNVVMGLTTQNTTNCEASNNLMYAMDVSRSVAFLRCCVNPFLYAFIGVKFRNDLLKLMKDLGCISQSHVIYSYGKRKSSAGFETETTTSFSP